jgi:hypothetical protein
LLPDGAAGLVAVSSGIQQLGTGDYQCRVPIASDYKIQDFATPGTKCASNFAENFKVKAKDVPNWKPR